MTVLKTDEDQFKKYQEEYKQNGFRAFFTDLIAEKVNLSLTLFGSGRALPPQEALEIAWRRLEEASKGGPTSIKRLKK